MASAGIAIVSNAAMDTPLPRWVESMPINLPVRRVQTPIQDWAKFGQAPLMFCIIVGLVLLLIAVET